MGGCMVDTSPDETMATIDESWKAYCCLASLLLQKLLSNGSDQH